MTTSAPVAPWIQPRSGLGDLPRRLRTGPCTIAYLGGSVTQQREGYRPRLHERLRRRLGREHRTITLAVGGVGSISTVFLVDDFILSNRPDLCIVELTTVDWSGVTPVEELPAVLDGIVTKLRRAECQVCFAHLYRAGQRFTIDDPVLASYEAVAERHGVPSLHVCRELANSCSSTALLRDVVHTNERGSELTARLLDEGLAALETVSTPTSTLGWEDGGRFVNAHMVAPKSTWLDRPAEASEEVFRLVQPFLRVRPGNRIRCSFDGELVGLVVIAGPTSGVVSIRTANGAQELSVFDSSCFYERLTTVLLKRRIAAGETVAIEQTDVPVDFSLLRRRPTSSAMEGAKRDLQLVGCMVR